MSFFLSNCSSPLDNVYEPLTYNTSLREIRDYDSSAADKIDDQISYCSYNLESGIKFQEILDGYNKRLELSKRVLKRYTFVNDSLSKRLDSIKKNALLFKVKSVQDKTRNRKTVELEIKNISDKDILYFVYTPFVFEDNYKTNYNFYSDRVENLTLKAGEKTNSNFELEGRSNTVSYLEPDNVKFYAQRLKVLFDGGSVIDVNLSNKVYEAALNRLISPLVKKALNSGSKDEQSNTDLTLKSIDKDNDDYERYFGKLAVEFCRVAEKTNNNLILSVVEAAYLKESSANDTYNLNELSDSSEKYSITSELEKKARERSAKRSQKIAEENRRQKAADALYKSKKDKALKLIREKIIKAAEGSAYKIEEKLVYKIFDEIKLHFQYTYLELDDIIITQREGVENQFYFQVVLDGVKTMKRGPIMVFNYD